MISTVKPVKEIALILDVSQVTVYNHIKKLKDELKNHLYNVKGATYLDDEGIRQLKISMGLLQIPEVREDIGIDNVINEISLSVSEEVSKNIKKNIEENYNELNNKLKDLQHQNDEIKKQNQELIRLLYEQKSKSFLSKFKDLFTKKETD